jgi:hypothetical protein
MTFSRKRPYLIPLVILFIITVIIVLNVILKPFLTIKTYCEVLPKEKWLLTKGSNGQVISSMIDFTRGYTVNYDLNQFERGEYISLDFTFNRDGKKYISKGDTIISIISTDVAEKLNTLRGDIAIAKANLKSQTTGDKEALIKEAQSRLLYNAKQIEDQKVMVSRVETLKSKGLGSQQEYETQKWLLDLYEIEKGVYQSQLENLKTGVKKEEKDLLATQVTSLETQYRVLQDRFKKLAILAPLSGRLGVVFSPDTLLSVINDKEIVLQTAIQTKDLDLIKAGQNVSIQFAGKDEKIRGEILSISREVKLIHGEQIVFASILLDNSRGRLIPGMVLESFIDIREMSFFEYLVKTLLK